MMIYSPNGKYFANIYLHKNNNKHLQRQQCINLVKNGMIRDMYPQLSLAVEIFLCAPISTATVERDFGTMNRVLTSGGAGGGAEPPPERFEPPPRKF